MLQTGDPFPEPPQWPSDIHDDFTAPTLRTDLWVDHYLPHWTTPERSRARYGVTDAGLELRIDVDQLDWRPEDAPLRVSNLQTGLFSGPVGSSRGTHRHRADGLLVRTETPEISLWAPAAGRVDLRVSASIDAGCMLAAWLVGSEAESEEDAGEICLFEIDGSAIGSHTRVRTGVKAHGDPRLQTEMSEVSVPIDASKPHSWSALWDQDGVLIGCEGVVVFSSAQVLEYQLFLMVDLFEIEPRSQPSAYPKTALVHSVRGWTSARS